MIAVLHYTWRVDCLVKVIGLDGEVVQVQKPAVERVGGEQEASWLSERSSPRLNLSI